MSKVRDQTETQFGEPARRVFATAGERLLAEGEAEGRARGRAEQARKILERQLVKQFGPLGPVLLTRISAAPLERLEAWLDRVVGAASAEEVLRD